MFNKNRLRLIAAAAVASWLVAGCATQPAEPTLTVADLQKQARQSLVEGDVDASLSLLKRANARAEGDPTTLAMLIQIHTNLGNQKAATTAAERLYAVDNDHPVALERLGLDALGRGSFRAAREWLEQAVAVSPNLWRAWNGLGVLEDVEGNFATAQARFEQGLSLVPGHPMLLANLGWSKVLEGHWEEAEPLLRRSLEMAPESRTTRSNLAFCLALQGRYEAASEVYGDLYSEAVIANNFGYAAMIRRDMRDAVAWLDRAMKLRPRYYERAANNLRNMAALADSS